MLGCVCIKVCAYLCVYAQVCIYVIFRVAALSPWGSSQVRELVSVCAGNLRLHPTLIMGDGGDASEALFPIPCAPLWLLAPTVACFLQGTYISVLIT